MKWIPVEKAKKLQFEVPVFVRSENYCGYGKLIKQERTKEGTVRTFQIAVFDSDDDNKFGTTTEITHVMIPE